MQGRRQDRAPCWIAAGSLQPCWRCQNLNFIPVLPLSGCAHIASPSRPTPAPAPTSGQHPAQMARSIDTLLLALAWAWLAALPAAAVSVNLWQAGTRGGTASAGTTRGARHGPPELHCATVPALPARWEPVVSCSASRLLPRAIVTARYDPPPPPQ